MNRELLLIILAYTCFVPVSRAQTGDSMLRNLTGEWVFASAELRERKLNSTGNYTKRNLASTDECFARTHFFQTPLSIRFETYSEGLSRISLINPLEGYDNVRGEWIREEKDFRLNLLRLREQNSGQQESSPELNPQTVPETSQRSGQSPVKSLLRQPSKRESNQQNQPGQNQPGQNPENDTSENMETIASYHGVGLSGTVLTMKYNYVYRDAGDNYVEGIFTVFMKKK